MELYPELHYEIVDPPSDFTDSGGSYLKRKRRLTWQPISHAESDYDPKILGDPPKYSPDSDMGSVEGELNSIPEVKETQGSGDIENVTEEMDRVKDNMCLGATARNIGGLAEFENSEDVQVGRRVRSHEECEDAV